MVLTRGVAAPAVFLSGPGRFEVAAVSVDAARAVVGRADEAWRALARLLALPAGFESPIYARVVPAADWTDPAPYRVWVEPGGIVSLRLVERTPEPAVRQALVTALLTKFAVWRHGAAAADPMPRWLVAGAEACWRIQRDPAQLDALEQRSALLSPPPLSALLGWSAAAPDSPELDVAAGWFVRWLETDGAAGEWADFLDRVLGGERPAAALAISYRAHFADPDERELWWQVGWHTQRREQTLPTLDAAESRAFLADLLRIVMRRDGREVAVAPADWPVLARSAAGRAELAARRRRLDERVTTLHPFYRNAGLSLSRLLAATSAADAVTALAGFDADWRAGSELEAQSERLLDAQEASVHP